MKTVISWTSTVGGMLVCSFMQSALDLYSCTGLGGLVVCPAGICCVTWVVLLLCFKGQEKKYLKNTGFSCSRIYSLRNGKCDQS